MENNSKNLRVMINEAAVELSNFSINLEFEDAQWLIKSFIQYQTPSLGHPKIVIRDEAIQSIRTDNIPKTLTFLDAADLAAEVYGMATGNLFLAILGGLFLIRTLYNLSTVTLNGVDSLMIMALLSSRRDGGYTDEEWLKQIRMEEKYKIKVSKDFDLSQLIERAKVLEKLKAVELVEGKWRFSDVVVFR